MVLSRWIISLPGTVMTPGSERKDFEVAEKKILLEQYTQNEKIILSLFQQECFGRGGK